jgi:hypothetical protein
LAAPLSDVLIEQYLRRLGLTKPLEPDLESLTKLVAAHVDRVCYENIDIKLRREVVAIDARSSVSRVAVRQRGGYCFIVVGAFCSLLWQLGFTVTLHTANCGEEPLPAAKWGDHVVAVVHFDDGMYVADVGLGEGPNKPFRLAEQTWTDERGFTFELKLRPNVSDIKLGSESEAEYWRFVNPANTTGALPGFSVDMTTSAVNMSEFRAFHHYYWTNSKSGYVNGPVTLHRNLADGSGILSLRGCILLVSRVSPGGGHGSAEVLLEVTIAVEVLSVRSAYVRCIWI